ncbi:hypothetical protein ASE67_15665 [Sphingomonas sp. Leaf23]|uniref:DUF2171 domain-containing protein n=1 Tax=Sphingomonas sp. Leaf23 TaxID=1735689 RepID=UPI0006FC09FC|nr:DUF2171 domain-containing protein [Sphingomonas sp. Leaf23]KQM85104.1 hypothetical protein ASE67_15665 [Sphingomonas sp. Leaf23]
MAAANLLPRRDNMNHLQEIFMAYDRNSRDDDWSRNNRNDDSRWRDRDDRGQGGYGSQSYGSGSQQRDEQGNRDYYGGRSSYGSSYGTDRDRGYGSDRDRSYGSRDFDHADRGSRSYGSQGSSYGTQGDRYRGGYSTDGNRFGDQGERSARYGNDRLRGDRDRQRDNLDYDVADRGFLARAGDEVRSWFGDEDAERRRERDQRYDEQMARYDDRHSDHAYRSWRDTQVSAFDRDYDEYRQENSQRFQSEFSAFRTERQTQRDSLNQVTEHMEVVGSDDEHVGTVDKVRGDRIILTKTDKDAGGHHHSIPSRWVSSVDGKVKLRKTASEAKQAWRDEEQQQAMFGNQSQQRYGSDRFGSQTGNEDRTHEANRYGASTTTGQALGAGTSTTAGTGVSGTTTGTSTSGTTTGTGLSGSTTDSDTNLNRSFPGTY